MTGASLSAGACRHGYGSLLLPGWLIYIGPLVVRGNGSKVLVIAADSGFVAVQAPGQFRLAESRLPGQLSQDRSLPVGSGHPSCLTLANATGARALRALSAAVPLLAFAFRSDLGTPLKFQESSSCVVVRSNSTEPLDAKTESSHECPPTWNFAPPLNKLISGGCGSRCRDGAGERRERQDRDTREYKQPRHGL